MENTSDSKSKENQGLQQRLGYNIDYSQRVPLNQESHFSSLPRLTHEQRYQDIKIVSTVFLSRLLSTDSLCKSLLSIPLFKSYQVATILTHEKGSTIANTRSTSSAKSKETSTALSIEKFYDLYLHIKKSKNRHFTSTAKEYRYLQFIGTYLATTVEFKHHYLVVCLSRNEFLSPSPEEHIQFNRMVNLVKPYLAIKLNSELTSIKSKNTRELIESLPFNLQVEDASQKLPSTAYNPEISITTEEISLKISQLIDSEAPTNYHFERINLLGELLNTLQHEINNPLFGINLSTNLLLKSATSEEESLLKQIVDKCILSQKIIKNFSFLYDTEHPCKEINVYMFLTELIKVTKSEVRGILLNICFNNTSKDHLTINTSTTWLTQIFFNLIINAAQAIRSSATKISNPQIIVSVRIEDNSNDLVIEVNDNGPGLPADIKEKIFQPFFTTKQNGTGLGLSICANLAKKMGAKIGLRESCQGNTTFFVSLPHTIIQRSSHA